VIHNLAHKREAVEWAAELLADPGGFIVLDTETTGLGPHDQIVQIAIIDHTGAVLLDSLVKPTIPIPLQAWQIHGIADGDVAEAPSMAYLRPSILRAIGRRPVVIYNSLYDLALLDQSCEACGLPALDLDRITTVHCAMQMYARYVNQWNSHFRSYRWQKLPGGDHSALGDARATLDLLRRMAGGDA
jgi:DNA polymerase-3 subunit epsilon